MSTDPGAEISLEQLAGVTAALAEGLDLAAVLDQEGIAEGAWQSESAAWKARLVEDGPSGPLFTSYRSALARAEDVLCRKVPPLDTDPAVWVGFLAAYAAHADPAELLRTHDLGPNDLSRLSRLWAARAAADKDVRAKMEKAAEKGGRMPKLLHPDPAVLRRFPWSPKAAAARSHAASGPVAPGEPQARAAAIQRPSFMLAEGRSAGRLKESGEILLSASVRSVLAGSLHSTMDGLVLPVLPSLPFKKGQSPPGAPPVKSPKPAAAPGAAAGQGLTAEMPVFRPTPALPFERARSAAALAAPAPAAAAAAPAARGPKTQVLPTRILSLEEHAAMSLEAAMRPADLAEILLRYGIDAATKELLDARYRDLVARSPPARSAWNRAYQAHYAKWQSDRKR